MTAEKRKLDGVEAAESGSSRRKTEDTPEFDAHYSDPSADLVLVSKNGLKFRASSFRLSQSRSALVSNWTSTISSATVLIEVRIRSSLTISDFFRDMISISSDNDTAAIPLPVDASSYVLRTLLNMFDLPYHAISILATVKTSDNLVAIARLSELFVCSALDEAIAEHMKDRASENPWTVFAWASWREDVELARSVLEDMDPDEAKIFADWDELKWKHVKVGLRRLLLDVEGNITVHQAKIHV